MPWGELIQEMAAEQAAAAGPAAAAADLTQTELDMQTYVNALLVPRATMDRDDTTFGFALSLVPPVADKVVIVGTGTPFTNRLNAEGQLPQQLTRNMISVVSRAYRVLLGGALAADGTGLVLGSGRVHVLSVADNGLTVVVRKVAGGAEFAVPGGMATLLRMVDRSCRHSA